MLRLTVALPMYNVKHIGWLPLESLARQTDVPVGWELLVAEEQNADCFGEARVMEYFPQLEKAGCERIQYIPLQEWVPLSQKWRLMGRAAAATSEVFSVQAADDFSPPHRLADAWQAITKEGYDWAAYPVLAFYVIKTGEIFLQNYWKREPFHPAGMMFSTRTKYVRRLPLSKKSSSVDGWFWRCTNLLVGMDLGRVSLSLGRPMEMAVKGREYRAVKYAKVVMLNGGDWRNGFNTHGMNTISKGRYKNTLQELEKMPFLEGYWPEDVIRRLIELRHLAVL